MINVRKGKIKVGNEIQPFLRWAGGKRWLAPYLVPIIQSRLKGAYREPFLGGGAIFFSLNPDRASLSDINDDLINTYKVVRKYPHKIIRFLKQLSVDEVTYTNIRSTEERGIIRKAVRFLYLNRTCYGGLFRTNREGKFNVPYGGGSRTPEPLWRDNLIKKASKALNKRDIRLGTCDFEENINNSISGDVVYCDPTYRAHSRDQFDRYGPTIFAWNDQIRLAKAAKLAFERGSLVIISNTCSPEINGLYNESYNFELNRNKRIGKKSLSEKNGKEYIIIMDPERRYQDWQGIPGFKKTI